MLIAVAILAVLVLGGGGFGIYRLTSGGGGTSNNTVAANSTSPTPTPTATPTHSPTPRPTPSPIATLTGCTTQYCHVLATDGVALAQALNTFDHDCSPSAPTTPQQCATSLDAASAAAETLSSDLQGELPPSGFITPDQILRTALGDFTGGVSQFEQAVQNGGDTNGPFTQLQAAERDIRSALAELASAL